MQDENPISGSRLRWYIRGTAVGMLLMATVNAFSYFVRSSDWSSLIGRPKSTNESIGFPFKVWEAGNTYNGLFADYPMLGLNIVFAFAVGSILGLYAAKKSGWLNSLLSSIDAQEHQKKQQPVQVSLFGLMVVTTISALVIAIASQLAVYPETLIAIYVFGPICLVALAMLPRRLSWQRRVAIITPATFILIAVAIVVGRGLQMEFDKVLMGIFLCWTPQSALAAVALTTWILVDLSRDATTKTCSD